MNMIEEIKQKSTPELKSEYKFLIDLIDRIDCFGVKDVLRLQHVELELIRRGAKIP